MIGFIKLSTLNVCKPLSGPVCTASRLRVGFNHHSVVLQSCGGNMKSAVEHPEIVSAYIAEDVVL